MDDLIDPVEYKLKAQLAIARASSDGMKKEREKLREILSLDLDIVTEHRDEIICSAITLIQSPSTPEDAKTALIELTASLIFDDFLSNKQEASVIKERVAKREETGRMFLEMREILTSQKSQKVQLENELAAKQSRVEECEAWMRKLQAQLVKSKEEMYQSQRKVDECQKEVNSTLAKASSMKEELRKTRHAFLHWKDEEIELEMKEKLKAEWASLRAKVKKFTY